MARGDHEELERRQKALEAQDEEAGIRRTYWDRIDELTHAEVPFEEWYPGMESKTRTKKVMNRLLPQTAIPFAPRPLPLVAEVLAAESELGRDMNGATLYAERRSWLDEQGVDDPQRRRLYMRLFSVASNERAAITVETRETK